MIKTQKHLFLLILTIFLLMAGQIDHSIVLAQEAVVFSNPQVENHFPNDMTFRISLSSNVGDIVSAKFVSTSEEYYSTNSYSKENIEFTTGTNVTLEYVWETADLTAIPMMPITYYWDVVDTQGNHYQSETKTVRYEDNRYQWQKMENSQIWVLWHDRPQSFGENIFDIADEALKRQHDLFQSELDYQIIILIYNNFDEFAEWHGIAHDWVGGESFTGYGITTQIVEDENFQTWLEDVIPHEISHLYFEQVTHNPTVSIPVWLNEGVSQYNEFSTNEYALSQVRSAAERENLISLSLLNTGFGAFDEDRVRLAYSEGLSAVTYMVETYGEDGLSTLLKAYKEGNTTDKAFLLAFGVDSLSFEVAWAKWAGYPGEYYVPTPWALPTFPPAPTMAVPHSGGSTDSGDGESPRKVRGLPCTAFIPVAGLGLAGVLIQMKRKGLG